MKILVKEASLTTVAVEVKSLMISSKQVTLAVFRQFLAEDVIDNNGNLNGEIWGRVNYFWGECLKRKGHLHIVWQLGEELRRACLDEIGPPALLEEISLVELIQKKARANNYYRFRDSDSRELRSVRLSNGNEIYVRKEWVDETLSGRRKMDTAVLASMEAWRKRYDDCAASPHLFIAV